MLSNCSALTWVVCVQGEISEASVPSVEHLFRGEENHTLSIKSDSVRGRKMLKILEILNVPGLEKMDKRVPPLVVLCDNSGSPSVIVCVVPHRQGSHHASFIFKSNESSDGLYIPLSTPHWKPGSIQRLQDMIFCEKNCGIPCTPATLQTLPLPYFSIATHLVVLNLYSREQVHHVYQKADDE